MYHNNVGQYTTKQRARLFQTCLASYQNAKARKGYAFVIAMILMASGALVSATTVEYASYSHPRSLH